MSQHLGFLARYVPPRRSRVVLAGVATPNMHNNDACEFTDCFQDLEMLCDLGLLAYV